MPLLNKNNFIRTASLGISKDEVCLFVCLYMVYRLFYNKLVFSQRRHNHSYSYMNPTVSLANLNGPPLQEHKLGKAWPDRGCMPQNGIQVKK